MNSWKNNKEQGFTLVEIIVVLVILAIVAVGLSGAIIYSAQNFIFAREANQLSQKAQLALARIKRELVDVKSISSAGSNGIQYTLATGGTYSIQYSGNVITMAGINPAVPVQPLVGGVAIGNIFSYFTTSGAEWTTANPINDLAQIKVVIVLTYQSTNQLTFNTTINPRRTAIPNVPRLN
jgi:prepilin-type N-terminal cleavage/methylation domain-containing protein